MIGTGTWNKSLWHRSRKTVNRDGVTTYGKAEEFAINYQPASGYLAVQQYGENISNIWTAFVPRAAFEGVFHVGDLVYLDGDRPKVGTPEYESGADATAQVTAVLPQNLRIHLEFTRIRN